MTGLEPFVLSGSLGVELFFFLSGFVLFLPYANAMLGERDVPTLRHFIERRAIKIIPSYYLAVLATAWFFVQPVEFAIHRRLEVFRHLAFLHPFGIKACFLFRVPSGVSGSKSNFMSCFRQSPRVCDDGRC